MVVLTSVPVPTEGIHLSLAHTAAHVNSRDMGKGTLYITEESVCWLHELNGEGFSLAYPQVALHAVSRDLTAFRHECLYLMLDNQNEEDEDQDNLTEVRFIPDDKEMLDSMFKAMNHCQALHPDNDDSGHEDDDEAYTEEGEYDLAAEEPDGDGGPDEENGDDIDMAQYDDADIDH